MSFEDETGKFVSYTRDQWYKELFARLQKFLSEKSAIILLAKHHQEQGGNLWSRKNIALFGIKASRNWKKKHAGDPRYKIACGKTFEVITDKVIYLTDCFRAYANLDVAIEDTLNFLKYNYPKALYEPLINGDPEAFAKGLIIKDPKTNIGPYMTAPKGDKEYLKAYQWILKNLEKWR
jgi:hypothetical protein